MKHMTTSYTGKKSIVSNAHNGVLRSAWSHGLHSCVFFQVCIDMLIRLVYGDLFASELSCTRKHMEHF